MPDRHNSPKSENSVFTDAVAVQSRIIGALIVRDMMMRYGRANIGFLWVVLEPMILSVGVMAIWSVMKSPYEHGLEVLTIVLTGYMPLTLYRHISNIGPFFFRRSISLLYHRHISFVDALVARALLEFGGTTLALITVYSVLVAANLVTPMVDPGLVALAWVIMGLVSFGLAWVFAIMTEYSESAEKFVAPFQYLMLPLSGTFFMVEWLPKRGQELILYNPTVHCYEMFRAGFWGDSVVTHYVIWYPCIWALGMTTFGLMMIDAVRERIHTG